MNDDFEQRLRTMLLTDADPPPSERFDALVRARISGLRRTRQLVLPAAAVAATVIVAWLVAPWFTSGAAVVAESSLALNNTLGAWIVSPAGYVLGAAAAAAALIDSLRR